MSELFQTGSQYVALRWFLAAIGLAVLLLHVWLHSDVGRGTLAGGSDSGMAVARISATMSALFVTAYFGILALSFLRLGPAFHIAAIALSCLMAVLCLLSGKVVAIGGVRGNLVVAEGWFMHPVRLIDLSTKGVEDDARASQWSVNTAGCCHIILTAGQNRHGIWTGPFIQENAVKILHTVFQRP